MKNMTIYTNNKLDLDVIKLDDEHLVCVIYSDTIHYFDYNRLGQMVEFRELLEYRKVDEFDIKMIIDRLYS